MIDEEELEVIRQTYEASVINLGEAIRIRDEKYKLLQEMNKDYNSARLFVEESIEKKSLNHKKYEEAVYEFWKECNE